MSQPETSDPLRALAREALLHLSDAHLLWPQYWNDDRAVLFIETALRQAQALQREADVQIADAISRQLASYNFPSASGAAKCVASAIREQEAALLCRSPAPEKEPRA